MLVRRVACLGVGFALLVMICLGAASGASAAMLGFGPPLGFSAHRPGPAATPVSPSELAAALRQQTGLVPSQVSSQNVCPQAGAGHVSCDAQVLVLKSNHALVHPTAPRTQASAPSGGPAPSGEPAGAAAPQAHTPAWLQEAYDLSWLSSQNGASDTVAIVDAGGDATAAGDLATFRSRFGLPACTVANGCFQQVNQSGQTAPLPASAGWEMEISLDVDAVSSLCPNCHILLVEANSNAWSDMYTAVQTADTLGAKQISMSFSGTAPSGPGGQWWFANASTLAATGDHGYPGAGENNYPAAYAQVTAVGGTSLAAAGTPRGYAESAWSLSGPDANGEYWGGASGCDTTQSKPSYQHDTGCTGRSYSDVAADADVDTGLDVYDTTDGGWLLVGGTSLATPLIAAYEAVTGISDATPQWAYTDSALLNDVNAGSTGSCAASIAYICNAQTGYDGPTGEGAISGTVATGAPGVGGSYTSTPVQAGAATLNGGVYPNGFDTTYRWEWGTNTSYGSETPTVDAGAGSALVPVSTLLPNLQPNTTYHYRLVATNADATTYGYDATFTTPSGFPPRQLAAGSIAGTPQNGQILTVNPGAWSPGGAITFQWQFEASGASSFSNLGGATSSTYVPAGSQIGGQLQVIVTVTNSDGVSTATTPAVTIQASTPPVNTTPPSVNGAAHVTGTLTADVGFWAPAGTYAYQWQEASSPGGPYAAIPGATSSQYTLTSADLSQYVRVELTVTDPAASTTADSPATGPVLIAPPANTAPPTLAGTAEQGQTLTAQPGSWSGASPGSVPAYTWQRYLGSWQDIPGATNSSYMLTAVDAGALVRVVVTESNSTGPTSAASASVGPVASPAALAPVSPPGAGAGSPAPATPPSVLSAPSLVGRPVLGSRISLTRGLYSGGTVQSVQFYRCAQRCVPIGATGAATYKLTAADEGEYVRAQVLVSGPGGAVTVWSANLLGPVTGPSAGATRLAGGASRVSLSHGAFVRASDRGLVTLRSSRAGRVMKLTVLAPAQRKASVIVRLYVLRGGAILSCTRARIVRGRLNLTAVLVPGETAQLTAVKRVHR